MELLIPGLILVALMVWASTKIKRDADAAFGPESIETDDVAVEKPDGFLHVINDDSGLAFRAYSKEYGSGEANGIRKATIDIEIFEGIEPDERFRILETELGEFTNIEKYKDSGEDISFSTAYVDDEIEFERIYRLVKRSDRLFETRITLIAKYKEEFVEKIKEFVRGFRAK
jgi:hypothetical protein